MIQTLRNGKRKASNSNPVKQMVPNPIKKNPYLKKEYVEVVAASALWGYPEEKTPMIHPKSNHQEIE